MESNPEISIVIPCYASGAWLDELVERIQRAMEPLERSYEVVLVNDASPDQVTWPAIAKLADAIPAVVGIDLLANVGQFRALMCGFEGSHGELVVTMDDDLQHPPEEVPKLIRAIDAEPETQVVVGSYEEKRHTWFRNVGSRVAAAIYGRVYGKPKGIDITSFTIMRRTVVDAVVAHRTVKPVILAIVLQSTNRISNVAVDHHRRPHGSSGWGLWRLVGATVDNVVNASTAPLRFVSTTGILLSLVSFFLGAYYLIWGLLTDTRVAGFATLVVLVIFFGGTILAAIGLLGEYIVRIVTEVTGPPRYVIRERIE